MVNYAKMHAIMCCAASDAMLAMPINKETLTAYLILRDALAEIEDMYYEGYEEACQGDDIA